MKKSDLIISILIGLIFSTCFGYIIYMIIFLIKSIKGM